MNLKYLSIESILTKIYRDYGKQLDEGDIVEWVGEALDALIAGTVMFDKKVAIINVTDYQCVLPYGCESILQIAKNNEYDITFDSNLYNDSVSTLYDENGNVDVNSTYLETTYSSAFWNPINLQERFSLVRLSGNAFYDYLTPAETINNPYKKSNFEYTIIDNSLLRFNFIEGQVYVAYYKRLVNDEGYPMIPDHYVFQKAIESYVIYRLSTKEFYNHIQGSESRLLKSEQDWIKFKEQARAISIIPQTIDEYERLIKNNSNLVQGSSRYENFFDKNYYNYGSNTTYLRQ